MNKNIALIIRKYLTQKASTDEISAIDQWYEQSEIPSLNVTQWEYLKPSVWQEIEHRTRIKYKPSPKLSLKLAIAASLISIICVSGVIVVKLYNKTSPDIAFSNISTKTGELKKIVLSDSTIVWLNSCSSIKYPEKFPQNSRIVNITGEAYFEVKHDVSRPFIVNTLNAATKVLGTKFTVHAYPNEEQFVGVVSGKVSVALVSKFNSPESILLPGDKIKFNPADLIVCRNKIEPELLNSWANNILNFDSVSLSEVAACLQRRYGITIAFSDRQIAARKFKGTFNNKSFDSILNSIALSMGLSVKKTGTQYRYLELQK